MKKMTQKSIKKSLCFILVSIISMTMLTSCKSNLPDNVETIDESKKLVIYTAHKDVIYKPIIREFEERTGIWVEVVSGSTNDMLDRIVFDDGQGPADIMFGGGVDSLRSYEEYFEPYRVSCADILDPTYASPSDSYTVFSKLPIVFVYNTKLILPAAAPRTWKQLLDYNLKGKIAFASPSSSGSSYTALLILIQQLKEEGFTEDEIIDAFVSSLDGQLSSGSDTVVSDVASGKKTVGITLAENALKHIDMGEDINMVYPSDGTCAVPDGCAIIKGAPHADNARLFMEFIVSPDVQRLLEDDLYRRSVRQDMSSSDIPHEKEYDIAYSLEKREYILKSFEEEMSKSLGAEGGSDEKDD